MKAVAVIPARLESTRFPRKLLADLDGEPMLWHVWKRASQAKNLSSVIVAADSETVYNLVRSWGGTAVMTSVECRSGSERIASILPGLDADVILNVQGDEPLILPELLDDLVRAAMETEAELVTPVYRITEMEDLWSPNVVKVVRTASGRALYFSRQAVPFVRDAALEQWLGERSFWGHVGVYAYQRAVLEAYSNLPDSTLEAAEKLEQLRFLEAGYSIQTIESVYRPVAVDTEQDLERVRDLMRTMKKIPVDTNRSR